MERKGFIGASDVPVILGLVPWKSPIELWGEKTGRIVPDDSGKPQLEDGHDTEPIAAKRLARVLKREVVECGRYTHPDRDWFIASPDRLVLDPEESAELKSCGERMWSAWDVQIPIYVQAQVQAQLACSKHSLSHVLCWCYGQGVRYYQLERHDEFIEAMLEAVDRFWLAVQTKEEIQVMGRADECRALKLLHPHGAGRVDLEDDVLATIEKWRDAAARATASDKARKGYEATLRQHLGGAEEAWATDRRVLTLKEQDCTPTYEQAAVTADGGFLYRKIPNTTRVLRVAK